MVDFPSSGVSWPAILRTYIQLPTKTSFSNGTTYTVYNRNHSINTFNNTAKLRIEKLIQKGFVDNVLETDYENYKTQNGIISTNTPKLQTAETNRDDAETELFVTNLLLLGKEDLLVAEQENRAVLAQQKSQLDSLKSTKSQLQTLYNRVKTIINQLKQHIASHSTITQAIADLLVEAQTLEDEITALELLITAAE